MVSARARYVGTSVKHANIEKMFLPGGAIYREGQKLASTMESEAKIGIAQRGSNRSGRLSNSLRHQTTGGRLRTYATLYSLSKVARWYHEGTRPVITSRSGRGMKVPLNRRARFNMTENPAQPFGIRGRVSGQASKPFMANAMRRALARRGIV